MCLVITLLRVEKVSLPALSHLRRDSKIPICPPSNNSTNLVRKWHFLQSASKSQNIAIISLKLSWDRFKIKVRIYNKDLVIRSYFESKYNVITDFFITIDFILQFFPLHWSKLHHWFFTLSSDEKQDNST